MAKKIFDLTAVTTIASADVFPFVDTSDTTQSTDGSTRKITASNLFANPLALGGTTPAAGTFTESTTKGTTGGLIRKYAEATADITAAASVTITLSIPAESKIIGAQLRVDAALAAGEVWNAAYSGGSTRSVCVNQAVAKNTKANSINKPPCYLYNSGTPDEVTTATTNIAITRFGGGTFTAQGTIRAIVYYDTTTAMSDAA